jgi:hypothetical protein
LQQQPVLLEIGFKLGNLQLLEMGYIGQLEMGYIGQLEMGYIGQQAGWCRHRC